VTFAEAVERPRVNDYPFTFIEIHLPPGGGEGAGKLSIATKLNSTRRRTLLSSRTTDPNLSGCSRWSCRS